MFHNKLDNTIHHKDHLNIKNTMLMCPAINFCEIIEHKSEILIYICFCMIIYKDSYLEFKKY